MKPDTAKTAAYAGFEGTVGRVFSTSEPAWPTPPKPPSGAPNVIVILADDLGFADLGCYGSEIHTPHLDRLASDGIRYTNFHVNPMCSPTRASMLTGLNHHMAGMGHVAHSDPGFPGYAHELRDDAVTMAELFRDSGWASLMVGKWHLCKDADLHEAASRHSWPLQRGFDRYYGILDGFTNFHQPHRLYEDNHHVQIDRYPDDYYFTDDLTDRALVMIDEVRSSHPYKPFFLYFAHGAVHAPLQAKRADIDKYRGSYDRGWDETRQLRYRRQLDLGVIPSHAQLPPRNSEEFHEVKPWDDLSEIERETFARYMEIFAGMVDNVDQNFGRLRAHLESLGEWDNTIVVFTSDNGGSREGLHNGTSAYFRTLLSQISPTDLEDVSTDHARLDLLGGPRTLAHYPMGWAMVSGTPFRLYKTNTHQGGHQVPFIVSWPAGLDGAGQLRKQYQHITDLLPTLAEMTGLKIPITRQRRSLPAAAGASMVSTLCDEHATATHPEQYYEMIGHRGYYRDGWSAVTCHRPRRSFAADVWELHNLNDDPTESVDLAEQYPDKLAELRDAWEDAAWANQVFPLDEGNAVKMITKPPWNDDYAKPVRIRPGTATVERWRALQLITGRDFAVDIKFAWEPGNEGMLVAHGDQGGGYAIYVEDSRVWFAHNGYGDMTVFDAGPINETVTTICFEVTQPEPITWCPRITVQDAAPIEVPPCRALFAMAPFEGIDVGIDRRSPVSWDVYERRGTFPYSGSIEAVTYTPGELAPHAGERFLEFLRQAGAAFE